MSSTIGNGRELGPRLNAGNKSVTELLRDLAAGVSAATGERFFQDLTTYLVRTLGTDYAFIGAVPNDASGVIQTISVCRAEEQIENFRYELADTPCQQVLERGLCLYPRHVRQLFPRDKLLVDMSVESYLGVHLVDSHGRIIGLMVVMDTRPMSDLGPAEWLLQIFAARAASELERREVDAALHFRLAFERLTNEISTRFINVSSDEIDDEIIGVLRSIAEFAGVDRSYVIQFSRDRRTFSNTHEWCRRTVASVKSAWTDVPIDRFAWTMRRYLHGEPVLIPSTSELPSEAAEEHADFRNRGVKSLASVPLICAGHVFGVLGFEALHAAKRWNRDTVALLETVGRSLAGVIARQRSELKLRASEERLQAILDNSSTVIYVKDLEGRHLLVNREFERLFDMRRDQVLGRTDHDLFPSEFADRFRANDKRVLASGRPMEFEEWAPWSDGTHTYISIKFCLYGTDGKPYATCGISTDITARERTARRLKQQEAFLRLSQQAAHIGSWEWDIATGAVRWSDEMFRIHGIAPESFAGTYEAAMALLHPEDRDKLAPQVSGLLTDGGEINVEYRIVRPDGTTRRMVATGAYVKDDAGQVTRALGITQDITERHEMELALAESQRTHLEREKQLRTVLEVLPVGVWVTDPTGNIIDSNPAGREVWGGARYVGVEQYGEYKGWWADTGKRIEPHEWALARAVTKGETSLNELVEIESFDGKRKIILNSALPIRDESGAILGAVVVNQDITERKRAEDALKQSEARLREAQKVAHLGHWEWDIPRDVVYWSEEIYRIFGQARTEAPLRVDDYIAYVHPGDRAFVRQAIDAAVERYAPFRIEHRVLRPSGEERTVACESEVVRDAHGQPLRMVGTAHDVTERRRAEAEMRKLSSAIRQTADAVIITDRHGVIEYVNHAFEDITGYTTREALGKSPSLVKSGMHDDTFYRRLWTTITSGGTFRDVFINRRKNGDLYYEEKTITPLKSEHGIITHFISTGKDITERMQTQERLQFLAHHDPLTQLPNRILFLDRLNHAITRAHRHGGMLAVMFVDLDRFKNINDNLGHAAGDQALEAIARRLSEAVREGDSVARLGGDEFAVLLEDIAHPEDIAPAATKLLDSFARPYTLDTREFFVTGSIGISVYPNDGTDAQTLLRNADAAMYRAKDLGKNTYQFYSADMSAMNIGRLTLESNLRHALARDEFRLLYQPQYDLATGAIVGVEALLRWRHPEFGLIGPAQFIAIAEETGMIVPIGLWVTRTACAQLRAWQAQGVNGLRIAVNVSARQFRDEGFVGSVRDVLRDTGLHPEQLELEITESIMMISNATNVDHLRALRTLGIRLALDDFGTGYSSLSYLQRFPISTLKIDKAFVSQLGESANGAEIVKAIVGMGHGLGLQVIAEGVETREVLQLLRDCSCDAAQGYLFSYPIDAAEIERLLDRQPRAPTPPRHT